MLQSTLLLRTQNLVIVKLIDWFRRLRENSIAHVPLLIVRLVPLPPDFLTD